MSFNKNNVSFKFHSSRTKQKCVFGQMQTGNAQISQRISTVWSGPLLSANRIIGHYRMYQCRANARMISYTCLGWIWMCAYVHMGWDWRTDRRRHLQYSHSFFKKVWRFIERKREKETSGAGLTGSCEYDSDKHEKCVKWGFILCWFYIALPKLYICDA